MILDYTLPRMLRRHRRALRLQNYSLARANDCVRKIIEEVRRLG